MRKTALLLSLTLLFPLLLSACGGQEPEPTGPSFLHIGPDRWAELITSNDMEVKQREMNRLGLGRVDTIPVLMALLEHENPDAVLAAFFCLGANMKKVERAKGDFTPWLPPLEKALASPHPRVAELAPELKAKYIRD